MREHYLKTAAFISLGCKVNQTETEGLTELFRQGGYAVAEWHSSQDSAKNPPVGVFVINTCGVTSVAAGKSRRLIRRMIREFPGAVIAVMGCYSQLEADKVRELGAHVVIGTRDRGSLLAAVEAAVKEGAPVCCVKPYEEDVGNPGLFPRDVRFSEGVLFEELPRLSQEKRVRATVKVQDGCSQRCSYCCVPMSRGPSRSRLPEQVLEEIRQLLLNGHKEIVLTGIHLGCYGRDRGLSLAELIERIAGVEGLLRLRMSSLEPTEIDEPLLEVLAAHKDIVCPHFHIPLQSGSDRVLKTMNRPYGRQEYVRAVDRLREVFPDAAVTTDIMAGFPGESQAEAEETLCMIAECQFAGVHAFAFSARPGTVAASLPDQVNAGVKADRVRNLIEAGNKTRSAYQGSFIGKKMEVLWEWIDEKGARGHTRNYLDVVIPAALCSETWRSGGLTEVTLRPQWVKA